MPNSKASQEEIDRRYMQRCLELAAQARGKTSPNPMVGAVIVCDDRIIGEGYHQRAGMPHAEIEALASVTPSDKKHLARSTMYVNLEPCAHYGRTPPCADAIIQSGIRRVVIATPDPNPKVSGAGIQKLQRAGIEVVSGVLQKEAEALNAPFLTYHTRKRPHIILKWAETADFFMGRPDERIAISSPKALTVVHQWRSEVDAILVGTQTAVVDNPRLTVRHVEGAHPLRLVLDQSMRIPRTHHLWIDEHPTVFFVDQHKVRKSPQAHKIVVPIDFSDDVLAQVLQWLYHHQKLSLLVEGGRKLLQSFVDAGLWDEARVIHNHQLRLRRGIRVPLLRGKKLRVEHLGSDTIYYVQPLASTTQC